MKRGYRTLRWIHEWNQLGGAGGIWDWGLPRAEVEEVNSLGGSATGFSWAQWHRHSIISAPLDSIGWEQGRHQAGNMTSTDEASPVRMNIASLRSVEAYRPTRYRAGELARLNHHATSTCTRVVLPLTSKAQDLKMRVPFPGYTIVTAERASISSTGSDSSVTRPDLNVLVVILS